MTAAPDIIVRDDTPPEWDDATVETDLDYCQAGGGLCNIDAAPDEFVLGDADLTARVDRWLADYGTAN